MGVKLSTMHRTMYNKRGDIQSTDAFRNCTGPSIVVDLLSDSSSDSLDAGFAVVVAAATGNEVVKQSFMELKINQLILQVLNRESKTTIRALYDAICVLLTSDDNRVVASQVYGYARTFAKLGIAIAVNDEICKSIAR